MSPRGAGALARCLLILPDLHRTFPKARALSITLPHSISPLE
jgi:hypothetical protein